MLWRISLVSYQWNLSSQNVKVILNEAKMAPTGINNTVILYSKQNSYILISDGIIKVDYFKHPSS